MTTLRHWMAIVESSSAVEPGLSHDGDYTTGLCHAFALAVNELTGFPMRAIRRRYDRSSETCHVYNEFPEHGSDGVLDAEGARLETTLLHNYQMQTDTDERGCWIESWSKRTSRRRFVEVTSRP